MKDDLISRQAAIDAVLEIIYDQTALHHGWVDPYYVVNRLEYVPTAEKRGTWMCEIRHYKDTAGEFDYQYIYCSECGEQRRIGWRDANYCPNCGARMEAFNG